MSASSSASVQELVPPINFSLVCPGVYRSGYPTKKNYPFLRALRLRSILYLCPEEYAETNLKFCEENGIAVLRFPTEGNKEPFTDIAEGLMHRILTALVDTRNHPVLIHCNKGKHRTGAVCGCLRLLQEWSLVSIFREYKAFSGSKARVGDQTYIELYYPIVKITPPYVARWLVVTPRATIVFSQRELEEAEAIQIGSSLLAPMPKPEKVKKSKPPPQQPPPESAGEGGVGAAAAAAAASTTGPSPSSPASGAATAVATAPVITVTSSPSGAPLSKAVAAPSSSAAATATATASGGVIVPGVVAAVSNASSSPMGMGGDDEGAKAGAGHRVTGAGGNPLASPTAAGTGQEH